MQERRNTKSVPPEKKNKGVLQKGATNKNAIKESYQAYGSSSD